jgi:F-type H+-transporting ATPase subunit epsilon
MPKLFHLIISSAEKKIFEGETQSLVAPGEIGYLGILANHAPLMTNLVPGKITVRDVSGKAKIFESTSNGFLEIINNKAAILLDHE